MSRCRSVRVFVFICLVFCYFCCFWGWYRSYLNSLKFLDFPLISVISFRKFLTIIDSNTSALSFLSSILITCVKSFKIALHLINVFHCFFPHSVCEVLIFLMSNSQSLPATIPSLPKSPLKAFVIYVSVFDFCHFLWFFKFPSLRLYYPFVLACYLFLSLVFNELIL